MVRYKSLSGDTGVVAYEIQRDAILVKFRNGVTYLYTEKSTGKNVIERMKRLALSGRGLSTYVSQCVRENYAEAFSIVD